MQTALRVVTFALYAAARASARTILHNYPGGDPTPSRADIEMTKRIFEIARGLGIEVHDPIVVGPDGYASGPILTFVSGLARLVCECQNQRTSATAGSA